MEYTSTLDVAITDYRLHQQSMGYSPNSVEVAQVVLRALRRNVGGTPLGAITGNHISEFMLKQAETRAPRALASTHQQLRSFFKWAEQTGRIQPTKNPMIGRRSPRFMEVERPRIPVHDFPRLLDIAGKADPVVRALVAIGLYAMLRDGEMTSLEVRDLDLDACELHSTIHKSKVQDSVPISAALHAELRQWLLHYESVTGHLQPHYRLLPAPRYARLRQPSGKYLRGDFTHYDTSTSFQKSSSVVTPLLAELGMRTVDENGKSTGEGAHTLRRSGARALYDALTEQGRGDALRIVQTMLHHKNVIQTQHYIGLNPDKATRDTLIRGAVLFDFERTDIRGDKDGQGAHLRLVR